MTVLKEQNNPECYNSAFFVYMMNIKILFFGHSENFVPTT